MSGTGGIVGIITALERELHPLVASGGWTRSRLELSGRTLICYENRDRVAAAGGIGCKQAEAAACAMMKKYHPQMLVSAGLAGALVRGLQVGSIVTPNVIVDAATGTQYRCAGGTSSAETRRNGENRDRAAEAPGSPDRADVARASVEVPSAVRPHKESSPLGENSGHRTTISNVLLVSATEIAGPQSKADLAERFHALAVDMEAAGVARVAQECSAGFLCVKAISDEFDFPLPPLNRFVDGEGNFKTGSFAAWTALRPQHWPKVFELSRNSASALRALAAWIELNLVGDPDSSSVVTLEHAR